MMERRVKTLIVGSSYGLLLAAKISTAGHPVTVVGRKTEISTIKEQGVCVTFPDGQGLRPEIGQDGIQFKTPDAVTPSDFDLVFLAIQEPQAKAPDLAALLARIEPATPVATIMNLPPFPYLQKLPELPRDLHLGAYGSSVVWEKFTPAQLTVASPDPQAIRQDPERPGELAVTLASNFKFAAFERAQDQEMLARVMRDASRIKGAAGLLPVRFLTKSSPYTPLAKWPMLVTGNCRCITKTGNVISIRDAIRADLQTSREIYNSVNATLADFGAPKHVLVPFESYLNASENLTRPSSLARALSHGAKEVERIDLVVLALMQRHSEHAHATGILADVSAQISALIVANRQSAII